MTSDLVIEVQLLGGHRLQIELPSDSPHLAELREIRDGAAGTPRLVQLPLTDGRAAFSFLSTSLVEVEIVAPEEGSTHPRTLVVEGHLGGYIQSGPEPGQEYGDFETWSPELWQWAVSRLGVRSVLDVGCGEGHAAAFFATLGCRVLGVDGSLQAFEASQIPDHHVVHDFTRGAWSPPRSFDMVWSCEFVEHVEERHCDNFLTSFAAADRYLLMTHATPGQLGWHHVNCRQSRYWIDRIERLGFWFNEELTEEARELAGEGHFRRSGLVFARQPEGAP